MSDQTRPGETLIPDFPWIPGLNTPPASDKKYAVMLGYNVVLDTDSIEDALTLISNGLATSIYNRQMTHINKYVKLSPKDTLNAINEFRIQKQALEDNK